MATRKTRNKLFLFGFITMTHVCIVLSFNNLTFGVNERPQNIIDKCIVDILTSQTQYKSIVTVINTDAMTNRLLQQIHLSNNVNICIKDVNVSIKVLPKIYLIHVYNGIEFEDILDVLDRDWNREPEALFIVIVYEDHEDYLAAIFASLWEYHFIHVLVIVKHEDNYASIYTYYPYAEGHCGRDYKTVVQLCDCRSVSEFDVVSKLREYDTPVLDNCTLNVAIRHYPPLVFCSPESKYTLSAGVERVLVELLFEKRNITLNYTCLLETEDTGSISDNFTVTGIVGKLYENEFDLMFGGLSLNNRRAYFFAFLCYHLAYEDMYVTVTHTAPLVERWKIVYLMFNANVWLLLLLTIVFCAVLLSDFGNIWTNQARHATMSEFLNLIGHATQNLNLFLREQNFKNVLITHWLWFVFLMNCFYQTRLLSFTIYPLRYPQLNRYHTLYDHGLTPCIPPGVAAFLKNSGTVSIVNEEKMDTINCMTAEMALDKVASRNGKYTIAMYFQYLWWQQSNPQKIHKVHLMKESVYNNIYGLYFKRGFPLLEQFNSVMMRLPEHGYVHAAKNIHWLPRSPQPAPPPRENNLLKTPLTLRDFIVAFSVLATGTALSVLAFITEIRHKRVIGEGNNWPFLM